MFRTQAHNSLRAAITSHHQSSHINDNDHNPNCGALDAGIFNSFICALVHSVIRAFLRFCSAAVRLFVYLLWLIHPFTCAFIHSIHSHSLTHSILIVVGILPVGSARFALPPTALVAPFSLAARSVCSRCSLCLFSLLAPHCSSQSALQSVWVGSGWLNN